MNNSSNLIHHRHITDEQHFDTNYTTSYEPFTHTEMVDVPHTDLVERRVPYNEEYIESVPVDRTEYVPVTHREYVNVRKSRPSEYVQYEPITHVEKVPTQHTDLLQKTNVEYIPHNTRYIEEHIDRVIDSRPTNQQIVTRPISTSINRFVRFINTITNSKNISVYINDIELLTNFGYDDSTNYYKINDNSIVIKIVDSNTNRLLYNKIININDGKYTVFIHGSVLKNIPIDLLIFKDDNSCPEKNMSKIRVINPNAESDTLSYQIYNIAIDNIDYGKYSNYITIPSGQHTIKLINNNKIVIDGKLTIKPNTIYTLYTVGYITKDDTHKLKLKILTDINC